MRLRAFGVLCCLFAFAPGGVAQAQPGNATLGPVVNSTEGWLNGRATAASLAGKVVIVDVFTFDCINCKNITPNLRALYRKRGKDLAIVGVHSPETPYERNRANLAEALNSLGVDWPVALDNSFAIWRAYGVDAWPTQLIFDRKGRLRRTIVGDSQNAEVDRTVAALVAER